jgi:hypothetical protein
MDDKRFGTYTGTIEGDDRASFIAKGQEYLLYLWYMADKMGILNLVLQVLDSNVSADGDRVPRDTQGVQQTRRKKNEDEKEQQKRDEFRVSVGGSLKTIAMNTMIDALRKEEEFVLSCSEALMDAEDNNNERKRKLYEEKVKYHKGLVAGYRKKLATMQDALQTDEE